MSQMVGMDVDEVRALSVALRFSGDELTRIAHQVAARIDSVAWTGYDATRFQDDWHGSLKVILLQAAMALEEAAAMARREANQQEAVSR